MCQKIVTFPLSITGEEPTMIWEFDVSAIEKLFMSEEKEYCSECGKELPAKLEDRSTPDLCEDCYVKMWDRYEN
jgi:hypothetical protein